jgi:hypothetical protein
MSFFVRIGRIKGNSCPLPTRSSWQERWLLERSKDGRDERHRIAVRLVYNRLRLKGSFSSKFITFKALERHLVIILHY